MAPQDLLSQFKNIYPTLNNAHKDEVAKTIRALASSQALDKPKQPLKRAAGALDLVT